MTYFGLTEWGAINWAIVIIALGLVAGATRSVMRVLPERRMMRCPQTGSITLLEIEKRDGRIAVTQCGLWPQRECSRGCLARYSEASGDFSTRLRALRPF